MDVLAYSALNYQSRLNKCIGDKEVELCQKRIQTDRCWDRARDMCMARCWTTDVEWKLQRCPSLTSYWKLIPDLPNGSCGFKVCGTECQFQCGACCQWTVPAGVSRARFQIWGAGGMSTAGCCCGGSPFGSTGAYASTIIDVSPGWTYTLCSGCAFCCYAGTTSGANRIPGSASWVTGCNLRGFCADGGQGSLGDWMLTYKGFSSPSVACCIGSCYSQGALICNCGGNYCSTGQQSSSTGEIPYLPGANYHGSAINSLVYGIRGMWPLFCMCEGGSRGYQIHPPVYGYPEAQVTWWWDQVNCCTMQGFNYRADTGYLNIPSAGAAPTVLFAGCNTACGDMGRMGMVCVTFC